MIILIFAGPFIIAITGILLVAAYRWLRTKYAIWSYRRERARRPLAERIVCSRAAVEEAIPGFLQAYDAIKQADDEVEPCGCRRCQTNASGINDRALYGYVVCSKCGNKRCPHATNHIYECTDSNDSGQPGSVYE
jgi:hypothetical protein